MLSRVGDAAQGGHGVALSPGDVQAHPGLDVLQTGQHVALHPGAQGLLWHLGHQTTSGWTGDRYAVLAQGPAGDLGVAMGRPVHVLPAMVHEQPVATDRDPVGQIGDRRVAALDVLGPVAGPSRDVVMKGTYAELLVARQRLADRDDEVPVAVLVT